MRTSKISVYVMESRINELIEFLHKRGIMEPAGGADGVPERVMQNVEYALQQADAAIAVLNKYKPVKSGFFEKRRQAAESDYAAAGREMRAASRVISDILKLNGEIARNNENISRIDTKVKQLSDYITLDYPMRKTETAFCETAVGSCNFLSEQELSELISQKGARLYYEIIRSTKRSMLIWCIYLKDDVKAVQEIFREIEFKPPEFSLSHHTPEDKTDILLSARKQLTESNENLKKQICELEKNRRVIELYYDRLLLKKEKYQALETLENTEKTFTVTGYVLEKDASELMQTLERKFGAVTEFEQPEDGEELPVEFKNNAFVEPVEEITASYSMPARSDIDPNPIMALFYYWFFGMMFSDAGYGLLMMIVCGILGFANVLEKQKRRMFKMFFWCGVSTTLWGIAYGSFFGDMIGTVSKTFGNGQAAFSPILIDPVNQALQLLIIAVAFGMIHILTALVIKFHIKWKNGDKSGAVFDVGFWIAVLVGVSILAIGAGIGNTQVKTAGEIMAIAGAAGLVLTGGRDKKSFIMKLLGGIMSLYDITGYVGDILSYSRLMALGLATGVIASVVNVLGSLGGNTPVGVIMFIVISIVGHSMNFAINMLGAYVHTNRLQYVEFYQKFYEGGGRRFKPFKMETKYFNFSNN